MSDIEGIEPMTCDYCGDKFTTGWMQPTGETMTLDGTELPIYEFFCSEACLTAHVNEYLAGFAAGREGR